MTTGVETIPILVTHGHYGDGELYLRFPTEFESEILTLLDQNGIEHNTILEFSAGNELWIEAVKVLSVPGGLVALTSLLKTFVHRHDGKRVVLKRDGYEIEAAGFSETKTKLFLTQVGAEQAELDKKWQQILDAKQNEDE